MEKRTQQNELWIYLAICWWLGSLAAWLIAWLSPNGLQPNDSLLTVSGFLVFGVSACLRLPVLTSQTPTSSLEDHFVWFLVASSNVNWLGYLALHSVSLSAVVPATVVGLAIEFWLWNQACKVNCLAWFRTASSGCFQRLSASSRTEEHCVPLNETESKATIGANQVINAVASREVAESSDIGEDGQSDDQGITGNTGNAENVVYRTQEDGLDPTGVRYLAGEAVIHWSPDQRSQSIVIGFVPAFQGDPRVELEVECDSCTAQIVNCTPSGIRIQLKRPSVSLEHITNLSWYAKQVTLPDASQSSAPSNSLA